MVDFIDAVAAESHRFAAAIDAIVAGDGDGDPGQSGGGAENRFGTLAVPTCPDWSAADLAWHLAEVQYFWSEIVDGNLATPTGVEPLERPDDSALPELVRSQSDRLITCLSARGTSEPCWSWSSTGGTVGWVRRRQAHEALIHRVDAELTAAAAHMSPRSPVSPIDTDLAVDGIDEMLRVMLDASDVPPWARFEPDGALVRLDVPGRSWDLHLGRFTGTDPSGADHDLDALVVSEPDDNRGTQTAVDTPTTTIAGPADEIDLWLWGRGELTTAQVDGDQGLMARLRTLGSVD